MATNGYWQQSRALSISPQNAENTMFYGAFGFPPFLDKAALNTPKRPGAGVMTPGTPA